METKLKLPTETVELPSKGLLYPEGHPLSQGTIEMKYMTAREEDILTNQNFIKNGTVIDKLLKSLLITDVNYNDLLVGDKNAIMVAARILSYGSEYKFNWNGAEHTVDLSTLENKELDESLYTRGENGFEFELPHTGNKITFKLLTHKDEMEIEQEVKGLQKINKDNITEVTTRLKHMITSVNGSSDPKDIREFVDKYLLERDARALREYYTKVSPDVNLIFSFEDQDGAGKEAALPIGLTFFWPDAGV